MKTTRLIVVIALAAVAGLALAGCASGPGSSAAAEPTMTAIPLPTYTPTQVAARLEPSSPTPLPSTATPLPPATPAPTPETTTSTGGTVTSLPPTLTPAPTAAASEQPKPTATPEFSGRLVFQTTIGGDFYVINADGADSSDGLRRITDGADPVWSPDGTQIAFARWREPRGVWVVDVTTGNEWRVFDWSEARYPSWSPDGEQIVFSRHTGGTSGREFCFRGRCFSIPARDFWNLGLVHPGDGSFAEPLPNSDVSQTPDWSPDGTQVVFDAVHGLMVQSVDGTVSYQLTDAAKDTNPVWSPDGSQVAFTRRQHDHWEVYVVAVPDGADADGHNVRRLTDTSKKSNGEVASSAAPAWSPDGNYIAFLTDRTGEWEIWVMRADGSGQQPMFGSELEGLTLDYASLGERAISWTQ